MHGADEVAASLAALTFDTGTRYLLVDGADGWKAAQLEPLEAALKQPTPDTVLVLIVRGRPLKQLVKLVEGAGGEVREEAAPKPWELPRWTTERAREQGLQLDGEAAKALVALAGPGQQRIARELEKLALAVHPAAQVTTEQVEQHAAGDVVPQAYDLADALVAGDVRAALSLAAELEAHGERPGGLMYPVVRRLREVHRAAALLEAGVPEQEAAKRLNAPPWLAKKTARQGQEGGPRAAAERALIVIADLEVELRGGGDRPLDGDSAFSLALARAAASLDRPDPREEGSSEPTWWLVAGRTPEGSRVMERVTASVGVPPLLRRDLRLDVHVLGLLEGLQALLAELAAEPRLLEAAERPGVVVGQRVVDPHGAGTDLAHAAHGGLEVAGVDVRAQPAPEAAADACRARTFAGALLRCSAPLFTALSIARGELAHLLVGLRGVAGADRGLEPAEPGLHLGGAAAVLQPLALRPVDPLFL